MLAFNGISCGCYEDPVVAPAVGVVAPAFGNCVVLLNICLFDDTGLPF